jgi:hypothetical protein
MTRTWLFAACSTVLAIAPAWAEPSLKEKTERRREEELLFASIKATNKSCGSDIAGTFDWPSFAGELQRGGSHVGLNCANELDKIDRLCRSSDGKDVAPVIARKIKEFRCRGGAGQEGHLEFSGKTIIMTTSVDQVKQLDTRKFVLDHL